MPIPFKRRGLIASGGVAAILALVLLGSFGTLSAEASSARSFVEEINQARKAAGVPELRVSRRLRRSSVEYGEWMFDRNYFGHRPSIRITHRFWLRGEVLARTPEERPSAASIVQEWLDSRPHRAVLLDPRFRFVGVGIAYDWLDDELTTLVTGHFGAAIRNAGTPRRRR